MGAPPSPDRPFGVTVLAVLALIAAVLALLVAIGTGGALIAVALTVLSALSAYGLWNLRPWAWPLALVTWVLGTIDAVIGLSAGTLNTSLVVGPIVILYLLRADIRAAFRRETD